MGHGNLEQGVEEINKEGWEIVREYFEQATGETYYSVEREKIDKWKFLNLLYFYQYF